MKIAKHFDSTWKARKRTKRCRECHKLFRTGDQVHGEYIIRTNFSGNTGNAYQKGYWYFWHIEHDRHELICNQSAQEEN